MPSLLKISRSALLVLLALIALLWIAIYTIPLPERLQSPTSTVITYDDGQIAHVFLAADDRWRIMADHTQIDPDYLQALLALEDKRFWTHLGVDPLAIIRAARSNLRRKKIVSGASTLTMQVARMSEPRPRQLSSKLIEAFRAIQIERRLSKEEILDIYLSLLPFGGNIEGLETASIAYFGHDASRLSPAEITTLLAIPQAPAVRHPAPENERHLKAARDKIAAQLLRQDALPRGLRADRISPEEALQSIKDTPVPTTLRPMPRQLPHLAYQMRRRHPQAPHLPLTIDRSIQTIIESMVAQHRARIEEFGADHVAVVVLDHQTGELKGAVGNFEYSTRSPGLAIPAFDTPRSTGSLLKPFLLARSIDKGIAAPSHRVTDIPTNFGGYRPQNFGGGFDGLVRLDDALSRSLNIPFVNLLNDLGVEDFLTTLHHLGAPYDEEKLHKQGLSIAIGGVDLTPIQVAQLFSALAREGRPLKVQYLRPDSAPDTAQTSRQALSPEAAWLTHQILARRQRPGLAARAHLRGNKAPKIAWKTGTSMGHRDAWTAGTGPRYTTVVWTGNLDYRPGRGLLGEKSAAPLFFDIMEAIETAQEAPRQSPPQGLHSVQVCAFSGHLPTDACEHTTSVHLPRQRIPTKTCPYHVELHIDADTGLAMTPACRGDHRTEPQHFLHLPPPVLRFFDPTGSTEPLAPPFAPGCRPPRQTAQGPTLISPPPPTTITVMPGLSPSQQQIPLDATTDTSGPLDWFVNGRFLGQTRGSQRLWWEPSPGTHEFVVSDPQGRSDHRTLQVR